MPKLFRKGEQHVGDEPEDAPAATTAPPDDSQAGEEGRTAHAGQRKAPTKIIVVADRGATDGHGEAYAFDDSKDATEFIRGAVEDGMEPSHLHVFMGEEIRLNVAHRVEVNLEPPEGADSAD